MDHDDARKPPRTGWLRVVRLALITIEALKRNRLRLYAAKCHGKLRFSLSLIA
jgi:hypothetical protein